MRSFKIYGIWPQASMYVRMYVNTLPECSPASVGLAQARPNKLLTCTTIPLFFTIWYRFKIDSPKVILLFVGVTAHHAVSRLGHLTGTNHFNFMKWEVHLFKLIADGVRERR